MRVMVVDEQKVLLREPYILRLGGWTLERFLEEAPDNQIWEFARGEVIMFSPATAEHQLLVAFLLHILRGYCEAKGWGGVLMGPAAVQILPDVVREPDIFVLAPHDIPKAQGTPIKVCPVLIIEVSSPSTRTMDLQEKASDYALAGIPEYWVVEPQEKALWAHRLRKGKYQAWRVATGKVISKAVPGFWLEVEWLFQTPLPPAAQCLRTILEPK